MSSMPQHQASAEPLAAYYTRGAEKIGDASKVTPEKFARMGIAERIALKSIDPDRYAELIGDDL